MRSDLISFGGREESRKLLGGKIESAGSTSELRMVRSGGEAVDKWPEGAAKYPARGPLPILRDGRSPGNAGGNCVKGG